MGTLAAFDGEFPASPPPVLLPAGRSLVDLLETYAEAHVPHAPSEDSLTSPVSPTAGFLDLAVSGLRRGWLTPGPGKGPGADAQAEGPAGGPRRGSLDALKHPVPHAAGPAANGQAGQPGAAPRARSPRLVGRLADLGRLTLLDPEVRRSVTPDVALQAALASPTRGKTPHGGAEAITEECSSAYAGVLDVDPATGTLLAADGVPAGSPLAAVAARLAAGGHAADAFPGLRAPPGGRFPSLAVDRLKYFPLVARPGSPPLPALLSTAQRTRERMAVRVEAFLRIRTAVRVAPDGAFVATDPLKPLLGRSGPLRAQDAFPDLAEIFGEPAPDPLRRAISPMRPSPSGSRIDVPPTDPVFAAPSVAAHPDAPIPVSLELRPLPGRGGPGATPTGYHLLVTYPPYQHAYHIKPSTALIAPPRTPSSTPPRTPTPSSTTSTSGPSAPPAELVLPPPIDTLAIRIAGHPGQSGGHGHVRRGWVRLAPGEPELEAILKFVEREKIPATRIARYRPAGSPDGTPEEEVPLEIAVLLSLSARGDMPPTLPTVLAWGSTPTHFWFAMDPLRAAASPSSPSGVVPMPQLPPASLPHPRPADGVMDLFELIEHYSARRLLLPPGCVRAIFSQVAAAVAHLHARGVVHRDVKDENVVVAVPSLRAQLADFGSASFYPPPAPGPPGSYPADSHGRALFDTFSGTLDFAPPEVLLGNPYPGPPQDVWSLGCLLFAMLTGANPFRTAREAVQWDGELAGLGRGRGKGLQGAVVEVLQGCLEREAGRRWTVEKVVGSRWVRGLED